MTEGRVTVSPLLLFAINPTTRTHGHFVLSPISLASRDEDSGQSSLAIDIYDLTGKEWTLNLPTDIRFPFGKERVTCLRSKLNYSLGRTNSLIEGTGLAGG